MKTDRIAVQKLALGWRHVMAAIIGNALEFYDFMVYTFFAIQIGRTFFPTASAYGSLMLSLATFGAGFVTRPIGGFLIGAYADRVGRRSAMMLSFMMMGSATTLIAVIPGYNTIGVAAPILVMLARMVQGFSAGGEVGPTTAFLLEVASPARRGLAVSSQTASSFFGAMVGGAVGVALSWILPADKLDSYGWRIAFMLGAITLPFGYWVISGIPETLHVNEIASSVTAKAEKGLAAVRQSSRIIILGLVVCAVGPIVTYVFNYIATFSQDTLHMSPRISFEASAIGSIGCAISLLTGGWLSDRIGRRPVMIGANLIFLILVYPMYLWMIDAPSELSIFVSTAVRCIGVMPFGVFNAALAESLPKGIRSSSFATIYAFTVAIFGGTCQVFITWLIHVTGNPMAPTWYLLCAVAVGQVAFMMTPESSPVRKLRAANFAATEALANNP